MSTWLLAAPESIYARHLVDLVTLNTALHAASRAGDLTLMWQLFEEMPLRRLRWLWSPEQPRKASKKSTFSVESAWKLT